MKKIILIVLFFQGCLVVYGDFLRTNRKTSIKDEPSSQSVALVQVETDTELILFDNGAQQFGYYHVQFGNIEGYIYRTFVRRLPGNPAGAISTSNSGTETPVPADGTLEKTYLPKTLDGDKLITHTGYISCMSTEFNVPLWVYEKISFSLLQGATQQRPGSYPKDPAYPILKGKAYEGSGYDHGHLAPAADFKRDETLYEESFYMTNMSPQHGCFNQKGWCLLESNVREWAEERPASEFYIFSGSIIDEHTNDFLCIGNVTVTVPSSFYKIIAERKSGKFIKGVAFLMANSDVNGKDVESTRTTIDEIEDLTGLNFFPQLTSTEEPKVEGKEGDYIIENLPECARRNSPCSTVYSNRVLPENRTKLLCDDE